jgi:hypothetical protein
MNRLQTARLVAALGLVLAAAATVTTGMARSTSALFTLALATNLKPVFRWQRALRRQRTSSHRPRTKVLASFRHRQLWCSRHLRACMA